MDIDHMKKIVLTLITIFLITFSQSSYAFFKEIGVLYLYITNPVEAFTGHHLVEQQHILPQYRNAEFQGTVLITRSNHSISDRWRNKPFLDAPDDNIIINLLTFGNDSSKESLDAAFRLGSYVSPYAIFSYKYNGSSSKMICTYFDGPSMVLYGIAWAINLPQRYINKIAYICETGTEPSIFCLIDVPINFISLVVEVPLAIAGTTIGTIIATILNPIDSLCSFLGFFYYLIKAICIAIYELIAALIVLIPFI